MMQRRTFDIKKNNRNNPQTSAAQGNNALQTDQTLELVCALHASLDIKAIIEHFSIVVRAEINCSAIHYQHADLNLNIEIGRDARHKLNYNLTTGKDDLGTINFSRGKRFSESEIIQLENLLCFLVAPLKNALEHQQTKQLALIDPLTGVANRAALSPALRRDVELAKRYQQSLSLLALDIDHFKRINDDHGHSGGDHYLQVFANTAQQTIRDCDLVFRVGGEEFIIILSKTDTIGAINLAERLRKSIANIEIKHNKCRIQTTTSIGISTYTSGDSCSSLLEKADHALYRAKKEGRNRVSI